MITKKKRKVSAKYKVTMRAMGRIYEATGKSGVEAISNLVGFGNIKGKVILTMDHGKKKKDKVLMPILAYRLFSSSRLMKEIALKNINALFADI